MITYWETNIIVQHPTTTTPIQTTKKLTFVRLGRLLGNIQIQTWVFQTGGLGFSSSISGFERLILFHFVFNVTIGITNSFPVFIDFNHFFAHYRTHTQGQCHIMAGITPKWTITSTKTVFICHNN